MCGVLKKQGKIRSLSVNKIQLRILHGFYIFGCQQEKYDCKDKHDAAGKKEIQFPFKVSYHGRPPVNTPNRRML